ncbi:transposase, partial [Methyloglobulus sp.]|uniref:transposase n=1 Tax=Methyloglobulus sp. TaxID=2518622 RepID=UPI003988E1FD
YGNKAHANVDGGGFIKAIGHTPGNGHDPQSLKKLLTRTEHRLCADKACAGAEHDKLLAKRPQHRGTGVWRPQATLRHRQGTLPGP